MGFHHPTKFPDFNGREKEPFEWMTLALLLTVEKCTPVHVAAVAVCVQLWMGQWACRLPDTPKRTGTAIASISNLETGGEQCVANVHFFTRTHWWVIPLIWVPVALAMEVLAVKNGVTYTQLPVLMIVGAMIWTFLEYMLHRFLFHMKTSSFWGNTFHYVIHGFHHKHPMDGARLVFPPAFTSVICTIIWVALGQWFAPYPIKLALYGGALLTYVAYDLTHYFLHFGTAFSDQTRKMKRYHLNHHFKDQTNGYGITTTTWDKVFKTLPAEKLSED
ncbi:hypothetical protein AXG93_369s1260 [Marchantia polymorpha subsp. ruderalis]|uniref:Fatty acid hydroxylase domain-containing protein n=1 Tax=Marchantia polymorpha subsp. ruderalis TaxID=1480154 RepID=A0A176VU49_MARPO|nr:hypothetical protein AXG93_369s1260 [Marchantia polymorpha subsp. ruderalis]